MPLRLLICFALCLSFYSCSSSAKNKIGADRIESAIKKGEDISYEDATVTDALYLIDTSAAIRTTQALSTVYVRSALVFKNCTFKGPVIASIKGYAAAFQRNLFFDDCLFEEDVNIEGATVNGYCNFLNCTFKKSGLFNRVTFMAVVSFNKTTIMETAGFQQCTFMNSTFFNEAHFYQSCFFQNSVCYRDFTFSMASCEGYTDFTQTSFYANMFCNYAHFKKGIAFDESRFNGRTEFVGTDFLKAEFDGSIFMVRSLFNKATVTDMLSLKDCKFATRKPETTSYSAGKIDISGVEVAGAKLNEF